MDQKHYSLIKVLVLFFSILATNLAFSQSFYFDVYGVREGLGQSKVYQVYQDKKGIIWLGTANGISSFNGKSFQNFNTSLGIAPNGVRTIHCDSLNRIWFGHIAGGISIYDGKKFKTISLGNLENDVTDIEEDENHTIWIATEGKGALKISNAYTNETPKIESFTGNANLSDRIYGIVKTTQFGLLFITDVGVKYFDQNKKTFEFVNKIIPKWPEYFNTICILEDSKKQIWVGTHNGGLYKFSKGILDPKIYDIRDGLAYNWISSIFEDNENNIWIGTWGGGVTKMSANSMQVFNDRNGLPDIEIRDIIQDYEGNILIGTNKKGLAIFKGDAFTHYTQLEDTKVLQVFAVCKDKKNRQWFGTNNGLKILDPYSITSKKISSITVENTNGLNSNDIRFVQNDVHGNLWIGTWGGGVSTYDIQKSKMSFNSLLNNFTYQYGVGNITALSIDKSNNLFVGTYNGLIYYEINNDKIDVLTQLNGLAGTDISALYTDKNGVTWVGARAKGISKISGSTIEKVDIGMSFTPTCFKDASDGQLWVGTESMGVLLVKGNKIIKQLSLSNGLQSSMITGIEVAPDGLIYIATIAGLSVYDSKTNKVITYTEKEGFTGIEIKPNAIYNDGIGDLWFGTVAGATRLELKKLTQNQLPPLTQITRFRVNLQDYAMEKEIKLNYKQNSILIDYQAICITNASKVSYKVMLKGADPDWQPVTSQTFANYPSLPPGNYVFMVMAANNQGVWTKSPIELKFSIRPPFWQTWWFYTIVGIILLVSIVTFIKIRERSLRIEKAILEEKVILRTQEIQEKNIELAQKNKDITDSINYARRIQSALMPPEKELIKTVPKSFIMYMPKDIVSGDFYWHTVQNGITLVAAADCTGHGVPGAFMSMISISSLNQIVKQKGVTDPGTILNLLRENIMSALQQSAGGSDSKDGLDIALVAIHSDKMKMDYAGAYNSLFIVKNGDFDPEHYKGERFKISESNLIEVKADRMPIGMSEKLSSKFSTVSLPIQNGDKFFISTDGYIDQFGGMEGKKLMSKKFKDILIKLPESKDHAQSQLRSEFVNWRGNYEQIDDVLVIGLGF